MMRCLRELTWPVQNIYSLRCGKKKKCVGQIRINARVILLCAHAAGASVTWWESLVTVRGSACTGLRGCGQLPGIYSIEPRVSLRRDKCALAKWTYSTWRAYRSVFTCLLSQVVQTGLCSVAGARVQTEPVDFTQPKRVQIYLARVRTSCI